MCDSGANGKIDIAGGKANLSTFNCNKFIGQCFHIIHINTFYYHPWFRNLAAFGRCDMNGIYNEYFIFSLKIFNSETHHYLLNSRIDQKI